jgi:hypothetical protein
MRDDGGGFCFSSSLVFLLGARMKMVKGEYGTGALNVGIVGKTAGAFLHFIY